jgi:hypothetical protein
MGTFNIQSDILQEIAIFLFLYFLELHCVFNLLD